MTHLKSVTLASAAAIFAISSLAAATPSVAGDKGGSAQVQCYGVNSCKGTSDCKSGNHDCKGMNDCKGQGFKAETRAMCSAAHGSEKAPA